MKKLLLLIVFFIAFFACEEERTKFCYECFTITGIPLTFATPQAKEAYMQRDSLFAKVSAGILTPDFSTVIDRECHQTVQETEYVSGVTKRYCKFTGEEKWEKFMP